MQGARPIGIGDIEFPSVSRTTVIGITFAVAGNVLISFALNLQKLAHARLEVERAKLCSGSEAVGYKGYANAHGEAAGIDTQHELDLPPEVESEARVWYSSSSETSLPLVPRLETDPLMPLPETTSAGFPPVTPTYGALFPGTNEGHVCGTDGSPLQRQPKTAKQLGAGEDANRSAHHRPINEGQESQYLKSKLWYVLLTFRRTSRV